MRRIELGKRFSATGAESEDNPTLGAAETRTGSSAGGALPMRALGFPFSGIVAHPVLELAGNALHAADGPQSGFEKLDLDRDFIRRFFEPDERQFTGERNLAAIHRALEPRKIDPPPGQFPADARADFEIRDRAQLLTSGPK